MNANLLITGKPGVGKTTLIQQVVKRVSSEKVVGFYTEEIREKGRRQGFELVSFKGKRQILSHVDFTGLPQVSRYGVGVEGLEDFLSHIDWEEASLAIIDEIGKMECFSQKFTSLVVALLDGEKPLLATVARRGKGLIREVKDREDTEVWEVTGQNRDSLVEEVVEYIDLMG